MTRRAHRCVSGCCSLVPDQSETRRERPGAAARIGFGELPDRLDHAGHSYGGAVISEAGNLGNVVGLVYIAAFAPDAGESPGSISQAHPPAAIANLAPDSDGYLWAQYEKFHESFCQDLTADEALVMAVTQKAPLASTFGDNITAPAWKNKPSWYQISSEDRMIHPENQKMMSARMNPRKVLSLDASHASLASRAADVAALIDEAATELSKH